MSVNERLRSYIKATMISNERVYRCACRVRGQQHFFTADASGTHTLMVDPANVHLLRDVGWTVSPVRVGSKHLQARATSRAPGVKKGKLFHRLATKAHRFRKVRAVNGNLLDARKQNLQALTNADVAIFARSERVTKLIGVRRSEPPRWLKTECIHHASISIGSEKLHLGSWKSLEEAGCAYDAAALKHYGPKATTNQKLGFISAKVARTRVCRRAAKQARRKVAEHQGKVALATINALINAKSGEDRRSVINSTTDSSRCQRMLRHGATHNG